jgi:hypothetical protein
MIERPGNLLYWAGCGAASLWLLMAGYAVISEGANTAHRVGDDVFVVLVPAVAMWLAGRAAKYLLAGK